MYIYFHHSLIEVHKNNIIDIDYYRDSLVFFLNSTLCAEVLQLNIVGIFYVFELGYSFIIIVLLIRLYCHCSELTFNIYI